MAVEGQTGITAEASLSELASQVRRRAAGRCEYCHSPESAFPRPFHIEHIVAKQHGGLTRLENLALACWTCNLKKGPNLTGIDPTTGQITLLFDPRRHKWADHFEFLIEQTDLQFVKVMGLTDVGRATVRVLGMNSDVRKKLRYELLREGRL